MTPDDYRLIDEWHSRLCDYHRHERQTARREKRARMRRIHTAYSRRRA